MNPIPYTYLTDPGHGWLLVPTSEVRALGIAVSPFSYWNAHTDMLALEEDCDMSRFLAARDGTKAATVKLRETHVDGAWDGRSGANGWRRLTPALIAELSLTPTAPIPGVVYA